MKETEEFFFSFIQLPQKELFNALINNMGKIEMQIPQPLSLQHFNKNQTEPNDYARRVLSAHALTGNANSIFEIQMLFCFQFFFFYTWLRSRDLIFRKLFSFRNIRESFRFIKFYILFFSNKCVKMIHTFLIHVKWKLIFKKM